MMKTIAGAGLFAMAVLLGTAGSSTGAPQSPSHFGDERPEWSIDGRWISVYRYPADAVVPRAGGRARRVGGTVTWSTRGGRMIVERNTGMFPFAELAIATAGGTARHELGAGTTADWSPDGKRIAFSRFGELYVADADGSDIRQLPIEPAVCDRCESREEAPRWSPDGTRLAFVHAQTPVGTRAGLQVMVARLDGTGLRPLRASADDSAPEWSPDGRRIAFVEDRFPDGEQYVWVAGASGGAATQLVRGSGFWWSPHSDRIAHRTDSRAPGFQGIRIVSLRGGKAVSLRGAKSFTWAPDGRRFAFSRGGAILVGAVDARTIRRVATGRKDAPAPAWSPDGRLIAYVGAPCTASGGLHVVEPSGAGHRRLTRACAR
jgi:Tol biopolymer transport system component